VASLEDDELAVGSGIPQGRALRVHIGLQAESTSALGSWPPLLADGLDLRILEALQFSKLYVGKLD